VNSTTPFSTLSSLQHARLNSIPEFKISNIKMQGCGSNTLQCGFMDVFEARSKLGGLGTPYLLKLVWPQRIPKCLIGDRAYRLYLHHKGFNFCISEIMGEGCEVEKSAKVEEDYQGQYEFSFRLPLMDRNGIGPLSPGKKAVEFKVYCREPI
jgi:hypothetical protein